MIVSLFLLLTLLPVCCNATGWSADKFPNPRHDFQACGNRHSSGLCDPDGIWNANFAAKTRVIQRLLAFEQSSIEASAEHRCRKVPVKITFAIFRKVLVNRELGETPLGAVKRFVKAAAAEWFASDECDRWLMVALAVDDRDFFAMHGRGVELSDTQICAAIDAQKHHLAQKQYVKAIEAMTGEFQAKMHPDPNPEWVWKWLTNMVTTVDGCGPVVFVLAACLIACCCNIFCSDPELRHRRNRTIDISYRHTAPDGGCDGGGDCGGSGGDSGGDCGGSGGDSGGGDCGGSGGDCGGDGGGCGGSW